MDMNGVCCMHAADLGHHRLYTSAEVTSTIEIFDSNVIKSPYFHEITPLTRTTLKTLIHMIPGFRHGQLHVARKKK